MFEFRIITVDSGIQIIDESLSTPINSLTSNQIIEYEEVSNQLYYMKRLKRKKQIIEEQNKKHWSRKLVDAFCLFKNQMA